MAFKDFPIEWCPGVQRWKDANGVDSVICFDWTQILVNLAPRDPEQACSAVFRLSDSYFPGCFKITRKESEYPEFMFNGQMPEDLYERAYHTLLDFAYDHGDAFYGGLLPQEEEKPKEEKPKETLLSLLDTPEVRAKIKAIIRESLGG